MFFLISEYIIESKCYSCSVEQLIDPLVVQWKIKETKTEAGFPVVL